MEVELTQDIVNEIGLFTVLVYMIEGTACSLDRQRWDVGRLAVGRDSGDAGSDAKTDVLKLTQLLHHSVDLLGIHSLRIKNGLCIIEDYEDLLRG